MVSFALIFPLVLVALGSILSCALVLSARTFLDVETYALARAHLYGNQAMRCQRGRLWGEPEHSPLEVRYECTSEAHVRGALLWRGTRIVDSDVDLRRGYFRR